MFRQLTIQVWEESSDFPENHSSDEIDPKNDIDPHCGGTGGDTDPAGAAHEPAWSLEGKMISADSCGPNCHCIIGGPPDNGLCNFFAIVQIENGRYGDVK
jgi:hypothetical protein